jgi:hypothetical protein
MQQVTKDQSGKLEHGIPVASGEAFERFRRATGSRLKESNSEEAAEE